jgi:hypothetical protein
MQTLGGPARSFFVRRQRFERSAASLWYGGDDKGAWRQSLRAVMMLRAAAVGLKFISAKPAPRR